MNLPLAVAPSTVTPGFYLLVNLLAGASSAGAQGLKALIISPPETGEGDITAGTEVRAVATADAVKTAIGRGLGFFAYRALVANDPDAQVDLIACAESAGDAAAQTLTFASAPTASMSFILDIHGVEIPLSWNVGESTADARDNAVAAINEYADQLFVIASAGSGGVVDLTARTKGPAGNDVKLSIRTTAGAGGTATLGAAALAGGTTEPDIATALSTVETTEYDFIVLCISNAEAQSASTSNQSKAEDHVDSLDSGSNAKLQQVVLASTGTLTAAATGAVGRNSPVMEHVACKNGRSLPCQFAGAEAGDRMRRRRLESNANRIGSKLRGVVGAADLVTDRPSDAELETAIKAGVAVVTYTANGDPRMLAPVTTRSQDDEGNPDSRVRYTNEVDALYDYAKDLRTYLPQEFQNPDGGQVKVTANLPTGDEDLPQGVVEVKEIRQAIIDRTFNVWVPRGVIDGARFTEELASLRVEINASDENQVDVFIPARAFKILSKLGVYVAKTG